MVTFIFSQNSAALGPPAAPPLSLTLLIRDLFKDRECFFANVMFDALCINRSRLGRDTDSMQEPQNDLMTAPGRLRHFRTGVG